MSDETIPTSHTADLLKFVELYVLEAKDEELQESPTIEHGTAMLVAVQEMKRLLSDAEKQLQGFLADVLPGGLYPVEGIPGVAAIERKGAAKRTAWQHHELAREVAKLARQKEHRLADETTGEVESEAETAVRMLEEAARFEWRTTPLKAWGIPVDEFCETAWGQPTVRIHKA